MKRAEPPMRRPEGRREVFRVIRNYLDQLMCELRVQHQEACNRGKCDDQELLRALDECAHGGTFDQPLLKSLEFFSGSAEGLDACFKQYAEYRKRQIAHMEALYLLFRETFASPTTLRVSLCDEDSGEASQELDDRSVIDALEEAFATVPAGF